MKTFFPKYQSEGFWRSNFCDAEFAGVFVFGHDWRHFEIFPESELLCLSSTVDQRSGWERSNLLGTVESSTSYWVWFSLHKNSFWIVICDFLSMCQYKLQLHSTFAYADGYFLPFLKVSMSYRFLRQSVTLMLHCVLLEKMLNFVFPKKCQNFHSSRTHCWKVFPSNSIHKENNAPASSSN